MALDAAGLMRIRPRGSPIWPGTQSLRPDTLTQTVQTARTTLLRPGRAIRWYKLVSITWDEMLPGMILKEPGTVIGALWIPHERSPLIYIQPVNDIGVRLVISTMVGEPCMRGLLLTVDNVVANAYIPVSLPVVFKRLDAGKGVSTSDLGMIKSTHPLYHSYRSRS